MTQNMICLCKNKCAKISVQKTCLCGIQRLNHPSRASRFWELDALETCLARDRISSADKMDCAKNYCKSDNLPFLQSSELSHFACKVLCVRDAGTLYTVYMMQVYCIYDAGILYTVYMMQVYSTVYSIQYTVYDADVRYLNKLHIAYSTLIAGQQTKLSVKR